MRQFLGDFGVLISILAVFAIDYGLLPSVNIQVGFIFIDLLFFFILKVLKSLLSALFHFFPFSIVKCIVFLTYSS